MADFVVIYAVLSIAWAEFRSIMGLNKIGKAYAKSTAMPMCLLWIMDYMASLLGRGLVGSSHFWVLLSVYIAESILIAEMLFIYGQQARRYFRRERSDGE